MNPDLNDIRKLLITLLTASLIVLLLSSCGTRKVEKSVVKEIATSEQSTTQSNDIISDKETKTVVNEDTDEIEVTPIDNSKAMIINGKEFKNGKVKIVNRKTQSTILAKETIKDKTQKTNTVKSNTVKSNVVKNVERKSNPFLPLLWLLLIPIGYFIYKFWNKWQVY